MEQILKHPFLRRQSISRAEMRGDNSDFLDTVVPHLEHLDFKGEHLPLLMSAFSPISLNNFMQKTKEPSLLTASRMLDELAVLVMLQSGYSAKMEMNGSGNTALHLVRNCLFELP